MDATNIQIKTLVLLQSKRQRTLIIIIAYIFSNVEIRECWGWRKNLS